MSFLAYMQSDERNIFSLFYAQSSYLFSCKHNIKKLQSVIEHFLLPTDAHNVKKRSY